MDEEPIVDCPACGGTGVVAPREDQNAGHPSDRQPESCAYCFGAGYVAIAWAESYPNKRVPCLHCGGSGEIDGWLWHGLCTRCNGRGNLPLSIALSMFGYDDEAEYREGLASEEPLDDGGQVPRVL